MDPIYFAHGYREREAPFAEHFTLLMRSMDFLPSLDPPSDDVNSAKLERHLSYTQGEIAVISNRDGQVSPYILYEVSMCIRAKKPLLVFIEDTVKDGIIPDGVLQSRFSGSSYIRQTQHHAHAVELFRNYIGKKPNPKYGVSNRQRTCLLLGISNLGNSYKRSIKLELSKRGYKTIEYKDKAGPIVQSGDIHFEISSASLAICCVDELSPKNSYVLGVVQDSMVPSILLTTSTRYPLNPVVPKEYQRRYIDGKNTRKGMSTLREQINLFEEDFLDLDESKDASIYANELVRSSSYNGEYSADTRNRIVQEITLGDKNIVSGQVGAVGSNAHAHDINFNQLWDQSKNKINTAELANEIKLLREHLKPISDTAEQDASLGALANAELEATGGNGAAALSWLAKSGKWAFDNATKIGVGVAAAAIKTALGL